MEINTKLIRRFYLKEDYASRVIYNHYSPLLKHIAYSILKDNEQANDIVIESFLKVINGEKVYDADKFISYLSVTTRNLAINEYKKVKRVDYVDDEERFVSLEKREGNLMDNLREILDKDEFDILIYRAVLGYSFKEIGYLYSKTPSSVRGIYFRARNKAKSFLGGTYGTK